jgi:hypothetical protein
MKKVIGFKFVIFILLTMSCGEISGSTVLEPAVFKNRKVLVIGIDGCRPDALMAANTPNLDKLMATGTFSLDARNIRTTSSGPGWSSILTGVWEEKHGVTDNSFNGSNFNRYPHFFRFIKDAYPKSRNVSFGEWAEINDKIAVQHACSTGNTLNASDTEIKAVAELGVESLTSLFLHFDAPDHAGHSSGFSPSNSHYIDAIEEVDKAIGGVIAAMKRRVNYSNEEWIVVVTTDHGGIGTSHGGDSEEERTIFMIVNGFNVPSKKIVKKTIQSTIPPVANCLNSNNELLFNRNANVKVPNNGAYNFGSSQDFSIECRFRTKSASDVSILSKKDWNTGLNPGYIFSFNPSTKKFIVNIGDGTNRVDIETSVITDNEWHTASATFDRDGLLSVYVDGILSNSVSISKIGSIDNVLPLTFGSDGKNAYKFDGYIAEVRIFSKLLSAGDIATWRCKSLNNTHSKYANLVGYWKMTEGSGTIINDSSTKNLHGMLEGAIWKDAKVNQSIETYDYTYTPRSVDVVSTVLNHLCIPIQSSWSLDGNSLIHSNCYN